MSEAGALFRTKDMALATALACKGYAYTVERLNATVGIWVFEHQPGDDAFGDALKSYRDLSMRVEPRSFTAELAAVRRRMYDALGVPRKQERASAPATDSR